jgi:hypothetical protein
MFFYREYRVRRFREERGVRVSSACGWLARIVGPSGSGAPSPGLQEHRRARGRGDNVIEEGERTGSLAATENDVGVKVRPMVDCLPPSALLCTISIRTHL